MISREDLPHLLGAVVRDASCRQIGTVGRVHPDDGTDRPTWVAVAIGLYGTTQCLAPLQDARWQGRIVTLAHDRRQITAAPRVAADGRLSSRDEIELYRHYGIGGHDRAAMGDVDAAGWSARWTDNREVIEG